MPEGQRRNFHHTPLRPDGRPESARQRPIGSPTIHTGAARCEPCRTSCRSILIPAPVGESGVEGCGPPRRVQRVYPRPAGITRISNQSPHSIGAHSATVNLTVEENPPGPPQVSTPRPRSARALWRTRSRRSVMLFRTACGPHCRTHRRPSTRASFSGGCGLADGTGPEGGGERPHHRIARLLSLGQRLHQCELSCSTSDGVAVVVAVL